MPSLTQEQTDVLLDKLSSDEKFRTLFQNQPEEALKQLPGPPIDVPPGEPGSSCMRPRQLLSAAQIAAMRDKLAAQFTAQSSFIPHIVDGAP